MQEAGPEQIKPILMTYIKSFDFFFTSKEQEYLDYEKLVVFFILYSSASPEQKCM